MNRKQLSDIAIIGTVGLGLVGTLTVVGISGYSFYTASNTSHKTNANTSIENIDASRSSYLGADIQGSFSVEPHLPRADQNNPQIDLLGVEPIDTESSSDKPKQADQGPKPGLPKDFPVSAYAGETIDEDFLNKAPDAYLKGFVDGGIDKKQGTYIDLSDSAKKHVETSDLDFWKKPATAYLIGYIDGGNVTEYIFNSLQEQLQANQNSKPAEEHPSAQKEKQKQSQPETAAPPLPTWYIDQGPSASSQGRPNFTRIRHLPAFHKYRNA